MKNNRAHPRILVWDIETSPMIVTTWGLYEPHLSHDNILQESILISAAWKWFGEKQVYADSISPRRPKDDRGLITRLRKVLLEADVLVAHNGDRFDLRKFNGRAIFHGLKPLPKIATIDTLKIARRIFHFNSNRLDYLGKFLCGTGKIPTTYDLWLKVMDGDEEALAKMVRYNKADVLVLEKVYERLRPFIKNHPNSALYSGVTCCPTCGSNEFQRRGYLYQETTKRQRYQCSSPECGAWFSGKFLGRAEVK
jgi:DNA polymerase elongation subunit (family B)